MRIWQKSSISRILLLIAVLILLSLLSLGVGAVPIPLPETIRALLGRGADRSSLIILSVRVPRTLAALLTGSALAVAGCLLQVVLNNAIASPGLIGINAGSGLFSLVAVVLLPQWSFLSPLFAFVGALLASFLVFFIGFRSGASRLTVILAGVAVSSLLAAFTDTILTLYPTVQASRTSFLIGGLAGVTMRTVEAVWLLVTLGLLLASILSHDLNILALGDETASGLGLKVGRTRLLYLILAALLAACAVSLAGLLGFVGLIVPHLARFLFGQDNRVLIPASALLGAEVLLGCDLIARTLFAPFELPVGIILAFIGAPYFLYWLVGRKRGQARA